MGKSSQRKKKARDGASPSPKLELEAPVYLCRAHELKEEGNRRFQSKDYAGAMDHYEQALRLIPRTHPDRAVFHSNRAACLLQMKPVQYDAVIRECNLALEAHPSFARALLRRARAFEATGKLELAMRDVQAILQGEGCHEDALEMAKRLRVVLGNKRVVQPDFQGKDMAVPSPPVVAQFAGTSPAALGASVVRGSPVVLGCGPCLPARPVPKVKKGNNKVDQPAAKPPGPEGKQVRAPTVNMERETAVTHQPLPVTVKLPVQERSPPLSEVETVEQQAGHLSHKALPKATPETVKSESPATSQSRSLKLIYGHDIRLAQLPVNCTFRELRELVQKKFPSSKSVLIKYMDMEGDLITITRTSELRIAEEAATILITRKDCPTLSSPDSAVGATKSSNSMVPLRLHVVEVAAEQEPSIEEGEAEEEAAKVNELAKQSVESVCIPQKETEVGQKETTDNNVLSAVKANKGEGVQLDGKEIEIDEWLLDFAHLFRTHLGIDPEGHVDLHELGMEFCAEALEETVTSEEAQKLFEQAACKFQEVAALAFFNWGNVQMCAARKRIPLDDKFDKAEMPGRLQAAFDWAKNQYALAEEKYEQALQVKPDFYEGVLAIGQERFESAKLRWSLAVASQVELNSWDSTETLGYFRSAEEKMQVAAEMWEKLEETRIKEAKASSNVNRSLPKEDRQCHVTHAHNFTEAEILEQLMVMRSQINLFWGNILFEHSQVEFKLGLPSWKQLLDAAVQKFQLAGASSSDISTVLKNHTSNSSSSQQFSPDSKDCGDIRHLQVHCLDVLSGPSS